ncbi:MAG: ATP12 family protein [Pseudomonadota bacterium]
MAEWAQKRFWTEVGIGEAAEGFEVLLDGRKVKTPAKSALALPTRPMAEAVAAEWVAQEEIVNPLSMPVTRSANAAIDKVTPQFGEVARLIAEYGDSDLLCYRADAPQTLVGRQAEGWDPVLGWAEVTLGARLIVVSGVIHQAQPPEALSELRRRVDGFSPFELTAVHDLVGLSGSLLLGIAVVEEYLTAERAWDLSRIDEAFQIEQWGQDAEEQDATELRRSAFLNAAEFYRLSRNG